MLTENSRWQYHSYLALLIFSLWNLALLRKHVEKKSLWNIILGMEIGFLRILKNSYLQPLYHVFFGVTVLPSEFWNSSKIGNSKLSFYFKKILPVLNLTELVTLRRMIIVIQCPPGANPSSKFPKTLNGTLHSCQLHNYKKKNKNLGHCC